jgi:hypothetical protein
MSDEERAMARLQEQGRTATLGAHVRFASAHMDRIAARVVRCNREPVPVRAS